MKSIGTIKESSLHRDLKFRYVKDGETEISLGNYVYDGQTEDGELIEVQTGSFGPLKDKISCLSKKNKIRVIYPIIVQRFIELYDTEGKLLRKRKSPKKGCAWDIFKALVYAPELPLFPGIKLELIFLDIVEKRKDDGKGSWRRKGATIIDRVPLVWYESIILKRLSDYHRFIPIKEETFTTKDLEAQAGIPRALAQKCLYVLNKMGVTERVGKQGNAYVYQKKGGKVNPYRPKSTTN